MNNINHSKPHKTVTEHKVITSLDRTEMDFLDKMGKDALFSIGHRLSYSVILKGLVDFAIEIGLSGKDVGSVEALKEKLLREIEEKLRKLPEDSKKDNGEGA